MALPQPHAEQRDLARNERRFLEKEGSGGRRVGRGGGGGERRERWRREGSAGIAREREQLDAPFSTPRMPVTAPLRQDHTDMTLKIWTCLGGGLHQLRVGLQAAKVSKAYSSSSHVHHERCETAHHISIRGPLPLPRPTAPRDAPCIGTFFAGAKARSHAFC